MGLTDKIEGMIEDFKKRNNEPEVWEILKKKLKKRNFDYESYYAIKELVIEGISSVGANRFLKVWDVINEHLNKKNDKWSNDGDRIRKSFEVMKTLSEIDNIEDIVKILAETGYELPPSYRDRVFLPEESLNLFNTLAKDEMYKTYGSVFKAMKKIGYKDMKSYETSGSVQLDYLIKIASLKKDAIGAIYVLASNGYQIDKVGGINTRDLKNIENIVEEDRKEKSGGRGGIPLYLYNTGNVELFQDYFSSLETENKKSVLRSILDEPKESANNQIKDWLEKDYEDLIREVGFED